jgi:hypothetical protein
MIRLSTQTDDMQEPTLIEKTDISDAAIQTEHGKERIDVENSDDQMFQFHESNGTEVCVDFTVSSQLQQKSEQLHHMSEDKKIEITAHDLLTRVMRGHAIKKEILQLSNQTKLEIYCCLTRMK